MSAGLQCLTATPPVQQHFIELQKCGESFSPTGSLMANFSTLLSKMWSGKYNVLQPSEFKHSLGIHHSQFKDYRQHDCQEFLALLLDSLHEQMNQAKTSKSYNLPTATITTTANETNLHCNGNYNNSFNLHNNDYRYESNNFYSYSDPVCLSNYDVLNPMGMIGFYNGSTSSYNDGSSSPNRTMAGSPRGKFDILR